MPIFKGKSGCSAALSWLLLSPLSPAAFFQSFVSAMLSCHRIFACPFLSPLCFLNSCEFCRFHLFSGKFPLTAAQVKSPMKDSPGTRHLYLGAFVTVVILHLSLQLLSISLTRLTALQGYRAHSHLINAVSPAQSPMPGILQVLCRYVLNQRLQDPARSIAGSLTSL